MKCHRLVLSILCITVLFIGNGGAQQFYFKNYTVKNGLGSSTVNNIFQDSKGYLWFGTQGGGVSRFNGREFTNYTKTDGLASNDITFITEDKAGNIWIGTADQGASKFNGIKFTNYNLTTGPAKGAVYSIFADAGDKMWFALRNGGIYIFDGTKFDSLTTKNGLPSNEAYCITRDKNGIYWFGLSNGIAKYDGNKITNYNDLENIAGKIFFSILQDADGDIWFGSTTGDVIIKDSNDHFQNLQLPAEFKNAFIGAITKDKNEGFWLATDHGVLKYQDKKFTVYTEKEGLSVNNAQAVTPDYQGNIWIGTLGGGVDFFRNETFAEYTDKNGLLNYNISCLAEDTVNKIYYAGTAAGLYFSEIKNTSRFTKISGVNEIEKIDINSLAIDKSGLIWVSAVEGVFVLEKKAGIFHLKKKYLKIDGQDVISPLKIIHDSKGGCWIASYGSGVLFINDKEEKVYNEKNGLPSNNILTVFEDSKSNIWIGSLDAGVIKYNGSVFEKNFLQEQGFTDKAVWSVTEDNRGNIYFGTGEGGLVCYDGERLHTYTSEDGICSNYISALEWDKFENCLWVGAEKGLNKIKFNAALTIKNIQTYREQNGFNSAGINQNAIAVDSKGLVWLGSTNGLWRYDREYDLPKIVPPKIDLTGIRLAYQKVDWKNYADSIDSKTKLPVNLRLSYRNNHLTFDIQALTTDDVSYTYKLEGEDKDWSPLTKNNEANYANISPGKHYTFRARAVDAHGIQSDKTISFSFAINPPWWTTWWFRLIFIVAIAILIAAFIKGRERVLKEQNVKLEKTVVLRTAEVVHQKEIVEEKNKTITEEKERSESLLLNILPAEVAEELKQNGSARAKLFDPVTVLFTDFKGFTILSEKLSPEELVKELDECFKGFDRIISNYNIEKIKTIGDAYMAVSGLPVPNAEHAEDMVKAAKQICHFMLTRKKELGDRTFEVRIGLHSGKVVAGIVGVKKYAYDIWGDTVNTAARMEQNGVPGKVNISEATYELIKGKFKCEYRGEIEAKNKGKLKMYFVERLLP